MSEAFDPYRKWLGIPPNEQPPNHYRLLGLALYEDDTDTIHHAADRQMAHLRTFQSGKYADQSQKLLNEVSTARICLLDSAKKSAYDEKLKEELAPPPAAAPAPPSAPPPPAADSAPPPPAPPANLPQGSPVAVRAVGAATSVGTPSPSGPIVKTISRPRGGSYAARRKKSSPMPIIVGIICVGVLGIAGLLFVLASGSNHSTVVAPPAVPPTSTQTNNQPIPSTVERFAPQPSTPNPSPRPRPRPDTTPIERPAADSPTAPVNNRNLSMAEIEARHVTNSLNEVRRKIGSRDLEAAKRILDGLEISIEKAGMEAEYEHATMLHYYVDQFISQGLRPAARNRMMPGDSFEFRGDRVELISRDNDLRTVTYKFNGTEATHEIGKIPTKPAVVFAWQAFERENIDPFAYIFTAAFLLLDNESALSETERAAMAKQFWHEAEQAGTSETFLAKELGIEAGNVGSGVPPATTPPNQEPTPEPANPDPVAEVTPATTSELPPTDAIESERFRLAKSIRDQYGRAIPPAAKQEVIDRLLTQIADTSEPAIQYVMYEKAVELACELGAATRVGELLSQWSEAQPINYLEQLATYLSRCRPMTEKEAAAFLSLTQEGYQQAGALEQYDVALKLADLAVKAAAATQNTDLAKQIRADMESIEALKSGAADAVGSAL